MSRISEHFQKIQNSLLALYADSKSASHTVVTGSLREGFVRAILQGHLPSTASWSTGQLIAHAPNCEQSGQLDIILHSGELPQIFIHDGYVRLVPTDACISVIEVKSELTTGRADNPKPTSVMAAALSSLVAAKKLARTANSSERVPFHIVAFETKVRSSKLVEFVWDYFDHHKLSQVDYWPESIVVLKGSKRESGGFGLFRRQQKYVDLPKSSTCATLKESVNGLEVISVSNSDCLASLVATLANRTASFEPSSFRLEKYIYD